MLYRVMPGKGSRIAVTTTIGTPSPPTFGIITFLWGNSDYLASKSKYFPCAVIRWSWPDWPPFITATCHSRSIAATVVPRADTRRGNFSVGSLDRVGWGGVLATLRRRRGDVRTCEFDGV